MYVREKVVGVLAREIARQRLDLLKPEPQDIQLAY